MRAEVCVFLAPVNRVLLVNCDSPKPENSEAGGLRSFMYLSRNPETGDQNIEELLPKLLREYHVEDGVGGRVHVSECHYQNQEGPILREGHGRKNVIEQGHLRWGVTNEINQYTCYEHFDNSLSCLYGVWVFLLLVSIPSSNVLLSVQFLCANKQSLADHGVHYRLDYHGTQEEDARLGKFIDHVISENK